MQKFNEDIINNLWGKEWFQFIKENPDKPWDFWRLSENPSITWDIVKNNIYVFNIEHDINIYVFTFYFVDLFANMKFYF